MNSKNDIEIIKMQVSCTIDDELPQQELNQLIDSMLEDSAQGQQLREQWKTMQLISTVSQMQSGSSDAAGSDTIELVDLPLIDVSADISKMIADEKIAAAEVDESKLIKPEITSVPRSLGLFKILAAGSAIAASLMLVAYNVITIENDQFSDNVVDVMPQGLTTNNQLVQNPAVKKSAVQNVSLANPALQYSKAGQNETRQLAANDASILLRSLATGKPVTEQYKLFEPDEANPFGKNAGLPENISILVNSNSIPTGKLYKFDAMHNSYINYTNPSIHNSNLIHKASLNDIQNNKRL